MPAPKLGPAATPQSAALEASRLKAQVQALLDQLEAQQSGADWRISDLETRLDRAAQLRMASEDRMQQQVEVARARERAAEATMAGLREQLEYMRGGADAERSRAAEAVRSAGEASAQAAMLSERLAVLRGMLGAREPFVASLEAELAQERSRGAASEAMLRKRLDQARAALGESAAALTAERASAASAAAAAAAALVEAKECEGELREQLALTEAALAAARSVAELSEPLQVQKAALESQLAEARERIAKLESEADDLKVSSAARVQALEAQVAGLEVRARVAEEALMQAQAEAASKVGLGLRGLQQVVHVDQVLTVGGS